MIDAKVLQVNNTEIDVVRKNIKNIHLAVYPPNARVRISAPLSYDDETIRLFAVSKWAWIKDNIEIVKKQTRIPPKDYVSGESHYLFGKRYYFKLEEGKQNSIDIKGVNNIVMTVKSGTSREQKHLMMEKWYRTQLKKKILKLLPKWEEKTGLSVDDWHIKKMKTRWGTCNAKSKSIMFNTELAKYRPKNIEYVILHELTHLIEHTHNQIFVSNMEKYMPNWKNYRDELNKITFE